MPPIGGAIKLLLLYGLEKCCELSCEVSAVEVINETDEELVVEEVILVEFCVIRVLRSFILSIQYCYFLKIKKYF